MITRNERSDKWKQKIAKIRAAKGNVKATERVSTGQQTTTTAKAVKTIEDRRDDDETKTKAQGVSSDDSGDDSDYTDEDERALNEATSETQDEAETPTTSATSTSDKGDPTGEPTKGGDETFEPQIDVPMVGEVGADLPGVEPTAADYKIGGVYGDHPHQNDGTHLDGGVADDKLWQERWKRIVQLTPTHYIVPKGPVGRRFITTLCLEFEGMLARKHNSERPIVFVAVILQTTQSCKRARDIRKRINQRLELWDKGEYAALVDDTESEVLSRDRNGKARKQTDETKARAFNARVLSGRLRSAVQTLTRSEDGGVLAPDAKCTKTGRPVLEVLREKHPKMKDVDPDDPNNGVFENYDRLPTPVPLVVTSEDVEKIGSKLSGAAGPGGTDAVELANWIMRFGAESERLRIVLARMTEWLANESPSWAAYRALMACRLVALDKQPGVRPVGIGEVYRRLMAKIVIDKVGEQATAECGNLNLCAGLPAGIEGAIHAMHEAWQETTGGDVSPTTGNDSTSGNKTKQGNNDDNQRKTARKDACSVSNNSDPPNAEKGEKDNPEMASAMDEDKVVVETIGEDDDDDLDDMPQLI